MTNRPKLNKIKKWKRVDISDVEVIRAYVNREPFGKFAYEILAEKFGCPEIVAYRACERALNRGLLEYGVSLRSGWLTDKGKELLTKTTTKNQPKKQNKIKCYHCGKEVANPIYIRVIESPKDTYPPKAPFCKKCAKRFIDYD